MLDRRAGCNREQDSSEKETVRRTSRPRSVKSENRGRSRLPMRTTFRLVTSYKHTNARTMTFSTSPNIEQTIGGTSHPPQVHQGATHREGGWPATISHDVCRQNAHRERVEVEAIAETSRRSLEEIIPVARSALMSNRSTDVLSFYFDGQSTFSSDSPYLDVESCYDDRSEIEKRPVSSIVWHPDGDSFLSTYCSKTFRPALRIQDINVDSYIWSLERTDRPLHELRPPSPMLCAQFHPDRSNAIVGGCSNGLVTLFDVRASEMPFESSVIESSHSDPVWGVSWISGHGGHLFASVSTDGLMCWWDSRRLSEPVESRALSREDQLSRYSGMCISYTSRYPNHYAVGTEQGAILRLTKYIDLPATKDASSGNMTEEKRHVEERTSVARDRRLRALREKETFKSHDSAHLSPVLAIKQSTLCPDYYLSVGDWRAQVWHDGLQTPVFSTDYHRSELTDGCWSTSRPGVFFVGKVDGTVDVWDLFESHSEPTLTRSLSNCAVTTLSCCPRGEHRGELLAVGTESGKVNVLRLNDALAKCQEAEHVTVSAALDREAMCERKIHVASELRKARESKRDEILATRSKENERFHKSQDEMASVLAGLDEAFLSLLKN